MSEDAERSGPSRLVIRVAFVTLCFVWGSTWIVIKEGLKDLPPFTSAAMRFVVAGLCMIPVAALLARKEGGEKPPTWLWMVQGGTNFSASYGIVYWVETRLPSGLVSLLWGVFPLLMATLAHFLLPDERIRRKTVLGLLVGFLGVYFLFEGELRNLGPGSLEAGAILLCSPAVAALGTILVKKYGGGVSSLQLNRNSLLFACLPLSALAFLFERDAAVSLTPTAIGSVLYLSVIGTCLTFGLYFWLMRSIPAFQMSLITYVIPVVALALGALFGGEAVTATVILGGLLILAGVGLARL